MGSMTCVIVGRIGRPSDLGRVLVVRIVVAHAKAVVTGSMCPSPASARHQAARRLLSPDPWAVVVAFCR